MFVIFSSSYMYLNYLIIIVVFYTTFNNEKNTFPTLPFWPEPLLCICMYMCNADGARLLCWQVKPYNLSIMLMHLSVRLASTAIDKHQPRKLHYT